MTNVEGMTKGNRRTVFVPIRIFRLRHSNLFRSWSFGFGHLLRHRQTKSAINRFQHGLGHEGIEEQLHVERYNNESRRPTENFQPRLIGKLAEFLLLARETHQRPDRETKL